MIKRAWSLMASIILMLTACGDGGKDYDAMARCHERGYEAGTENYDRCLMEEKMERLRKQREEIDEMQRVRERQQILLNRY